MSIYTANKYKKTSPNDAWYKIFQFIEPGVRILDVGCSSGNLGKALKKEKKVQVVGLDIDKDDVELAKKNLDEAYLINIEQDDISHFGKFDVIIMADVIEHLVNPVAALEKLRTILKPGGRLVFSIPNMANITIRMELLKGHFEYKDFGLLDRTHLHFYDRKEVERVFTGSGFAVKQYDCTIRSIPNNIMDKELAEIGLTLTSNFEKFAQEGDALIYQFIGWAQPSKGAHTAVSTSSPLDSISREIDKITADYSNELRKVQASYEEAESRLQKEAERLKVENKQLTDELTTIKTSKGWKLLTKVWSAKAKISSKKS